MSDPANANGPEIEANVHKGSHPKTHDEIAEAMRVLFRQTHNVAEGVGAAAPAAIFKERDQIAKKNVPAIAIVANIDTQMSAELLNGKTLKLDLD